MDVIADINDKVNASLEYEQGTAGWSAVEEALSKGDCRSFAKAKYQALKDAGLPARMIYVMSDQGPHVVAESDGKVLDNIEPTVKNLSERKDLRAAFWFDDDGVYQMDGTRVGGIELITGFKK